MKTIWQLVLSLSAACFLIAAAPGSAEAAGAGDCGCANVPESATEAMEQASMVFRGKVLAEKDEFVDGVKYRTALFLVHQTWKGVQQTQVIIRTPELACPFEWQMYNDYLIYAHEKDGIVIVDGCTRSASIEMAEADLQQLGEGAAPETIVDLQDEFGDDNSVYMIGFLLSLGVVIGSVVVMIRRYRKYKQFQ